MAQQKTDIELIAELSDLTVARQEIEKRAAEINAELGKRVAEFKSSKKQSDEKK